MSQEHVSSKDSKNSSQSKYNSVPTLRPNPDSQTSSKRGYQESPPAPIDKLGMPMVAPNGDPDDPDPSSSKSGSSKSSRKKAKPYDIDDDITMDGSIKSTWSTRSTRSSRSRAEKDADIELRMRNKAYSQRLKFDSSLKWNGTSATFRPFSKALEGHLIMGGATYMTSNKFISTYLEIGSSYLDSSPFWQTHNVSHPQAHFDRNYLYGILMLSTQNQQHKTLMKYDESKDSIMAWAELKKENDHNGSKELRMEQLEQLMTIPYSTRDAGGIAAYIDRLQVIVQELETLDPNEYGDNRKKRLLLINVKSTHGIAHLIQKCRDRKFMNFNACAAYLTLSLPLSKILDINDKPGKESKN